MLLYQRVITWMNLPMLMNHVGAPMLHGALSTSLVLAFGSYQQWNPKHVVKMPTCCPTSCLVFPLSDMICAAYIYIHIDTYAITKEYVYIYIEYRSVSLQNTMCFPVILGCSSYETHSNHDIYIYVEISMICVIFNPLGHISIPHSWVHWLFFSLCLIDSRVVTVVPPLPRLFLSRGSSGLDLFANLLLVHCPRLGGDCPDIWQMGYPWVTPMENIEKYEEFTHGFAGKMIHNQWIFMDRYPIYVSLPMGTPCFTRGGKLNPFYFSGASHSSINFTWMKNLIWASHWGLDDLVGGLGRMLNCGLLMISGGSCMMWSWHAMVLSWCPRRLLSALLREIVRLKVRLLLAHVVLSSAQVLGMAGNDGEFPLWDDSYTDKIEKQNEGQIYR